eukprot:TRINITY_DN11069_c0_g1_i2.p1 TRINITY_DN11069_c0_g1~~TRINITY_DN11069_c0_g1_i2.p1  ORF type:complete len:545 (+),score=138.20 TRINITY_DN11069_c0_g1_i2:60-1694(+)
MGPEQPINTSLDDSQIKLLNNNTSFDVDPGMNLLTMKNIQVHNLLAQQNDRPREPVRLVRDPQPQAPPPPPPMLPPEAPEENKEAGIIGVVRQNDVNLTLTSNRGGQSGVGFNEGASQQGNNATGRSFALSFKRPKVDARDSGLQRPPNSQLQEQEGSSNIPQELPNFDPLNNINPLANTPSHLGQRDLTIRTPQGRVPLPPLGVQNTQQGQPVNALAANVQALPRQNSGAPPPIQQQNTGQLGVIRQGTGQQLGPRQMTGQQQVPTQPRSRGNNLTVPSREQGRRRSPRNAPPSQGSPERVDPATPVSPPTSVARAEPDEKKEVQFGQSDIKKGELDDEKKMNQVAKKEELKLLKEKHRGKKTLGYCVKRSHGLLNIVSISSFTSPRSNRVTLFFLNLYIHALIGSVVVKLLNQQPPFDPNEITTPNMPTQMDFIWYALINAFAAVPIMYIFSVVFRVPDREIRSAKTVHQLDQVKLRVQKNVKSKSVTGHILSWLMMGFAFWFVAQFSCDYGWAYSWTWFWSVVLSFGVYDLIVLELSLIHI